MALFLELDAGDSLRIGNDTVVRLELKSGKRARLRIDSPSDVKHVKSGEIEPAALQRKPPVSAPAPEAPRQSMFKRALMA